MPRSRTPLTLLLAAVATAAAACSSGASGAASGTTDTTGASVPASVPAGTTLRVADQLGALETPLAISGENKGLPYKVSYSSFVGGPPMLQAFQAGAVDLGWTAGTPAIFAQAAHQSVVVVAALATEYAPYVLVNAPGQHITSWAALKGKSVAYQEGTVEESVLLQGLRSAGLTLKDVTSVNLSTSALVPALKAGKVDTAILPTAQAAVYLAQYPKAVQVPVTKDITGREWFLIASTSALAKPATEAAIGDYITRFTKAIAWDNTHPSAYAKAVYVDQFHLSLAAGEALLKAQGPMTFYDLPGPFLTPQQNLADMYAQAGVIPAKEDVAPEFTSRYNATVDAAQKPSGS